LLEAVSATVTVLLEETSTSCEPNPTYETVRVFTDPGTEMEKVPSVPVVVPLLVPFGLTVAPTIGEPSFASVTVPVTTLS